MGREASGLRCFELGEEPSGEDVELRLAPLPMIKLDFSWWPPRGKFSEVETGPGFHDVRWKLFFFRTLALYAARMAVADSLIVLTVLLFE